MDYDTRCKGQVRAVEITVFNVNKSLVPWPTGVDVGVTYCKSVEL
jgi:hypothetical protein